MHTHPDQAAQPGLLHEVVDVRLADAGCHPGHQPVPRACLEAGDRPVEDAGAAATLVAHDGGPLDADERRDVPQAAQLGGLRVVDQVAVGEELEVAVRVCGEEVKQLRVHQRLAPEDAEVAVAVRLRVADDPIQLVKFNLAARRLDIDPASLAPQLAARDDRDEKERREVLPPLQSLFVALDGADPLDAHVPHELAECAGIGLGQHPAGEGKHHGIRTPGAAYAFRRRCRTPPRADRRRRGSRRPPPAPAAAPLPPSPESRRASAGWRVPRRECRGSPAA